MCQSRISLSTNQIIMALKGKNINFPGGTIADSGKEAIVRTVGEFDTESEIEKVFIRSNDAGKIEEITIVRGFLTWKIQSAMFAARVPDVIVMGIVKGKHDLGKRP